MVGEIKAGKKAIEELQKHKEQIHNQIRKLEKMIEEGQQGDMIPSMMQSSRRSQILNRNCLRLKLGPHGSVDQ
jgi:ferritin-like metal-binding protein YciE